jgi:hypothetical protein
MFRICLVLILIIQVFLVQDLFAQRYGTAAGLRMGNNSYSRTIGLTAQQRVFKHVTLEGIVQSDFDRNTTFHLLIQKHKPILSKRFNYYLGAGVSSGWEESFVKVPESNQIIHTYGNPTTGVDLVGGIEMTIANTVISLDYKPNFNLSGREEFYRSQVGISARMVLVKSKEQDKKRRKKQREKRKAKRRK